MRYIISQLIGTRAAEVTFALGLYWILTTGLALLMSLLFVSFTISAARRFKILARASERSSHIVPTPRLGGVGMALAFYLPVLCLGKWWPLTSEPWFGAMIVGSGWALVGGFLDDVLELPPRWKFLFQFAAAGSAVILGFHPEHFDIPFGTFINLPWWAADAFTFAFIVFFMNAFNFMDGMDGQAALFGAVASMGIGMTFAEADLRKHGVELFTAAIMAGALLGLLYHNYPGKPQAEKTFMGDSGSQFAGYVLAIFCLRASEVQVGGFGFKSALILLSPFIWDVCYTIVRRLLRGENILEAHRSHLYQKLLIAGWSHGDVLRLNVLLWALCFMLARSHARAIGEGNQDLRDLAISGTLLALLLYTLFVERFATPRQKTPPQSAPQ